MARALIAIKDIARLRQGCAKGAQQGARRACEQCGQFVLFDLLRCPSRARLRAPDNPKFNLAFWCPSRARLRGKSTVDVTFDPGAHRVRACEAKLLTVFAQHDHAHRIRACEGLHE